MSESIVERNILTIIEPAINLIQLNIRSQGDETTFKPIRIDFTVVDCKPVGGGGGTKANEYLVTGRMFIPKLFAESIEYEEDVTSFDALLNIAENMQLGFASNVEQTADQMTWTNPNDTTETWIQDIVANSYAGDTMGAQGADGQEDNFPNYLSNLIQMQGGGRYISKYQMVNKSGEISKANGYKRYTQYWDLESKEWISEYVDPLTNDTPGMIPATKGRLIDGEVEGPRNNQVKYKYLGTQ